MLLSILRALTYLLGIAGSALLLPLAVAIADSDRRMAIAFLVPLLAGWIVAAVFWFAVRKRPKVFDVKSAFGVVGLIWIAICLFGSIPLHFSGAFPSYMDALFESVSGFTTTGASVLADVESLPRSVNLWRCETHWLGGMGVIALAVAGLDVFTFLAAAASMVGNVGPAFGQLGPTANYGFLPAPLKLWYCFAMLAGRLEIYTLLIMIGRVCRVATASRETRGVRPGRAAAPSPVP